MLFSGTTRYFVQYLTRPDRILKNPTRWAPDDGEEEEDGDLVQILLFYAECQAKVYALEDTLSNKQTSDLSQQHRHQMLEKPLPPPLETKEHWPVSDLRAQFPP